MKTLEKIILNTWILGLFLFSTSILLPLNLRNIPFFFFVITACFYLTKSKKIINLRHSKILALNSLYFTVMALSLVQSDNTSESFTNLLSASPLIIAPLMFYSVHSRLVINFNFITIYLYISFFCSTVLFFLLLIIHNYFQGYITETYFLHFPERINIGFGKYSIHPLYASISVIISLIFSVPIFEKAKTRSTKLFVLLSAIFLFAILLLLARKSAILITGLIFVAHFFKRRNRKHLPYFFIALLTCSALIYIIDPLWLRFYELIETIQHSGQTSTGSTYTRLNIFNCSLDAIKNAPFFGYGIGDVKEVLTVCFLENNSTYYNTHNQFLGAWLSAGFFGTSSLVLIFFQGFISALKHKNIIHFSILSLFFLMALIENILERQDGILIFSFFTNFFIFMETSNSSRITTYDIR